MEKNRIVHLGIIGIFLSLYFLVATISMINSVAFFDLAHDGLMNWALAIGFELGAAASLAAIIILDKTNRTMVWSLFILLTAFQMMANSFHAFINLEDYMGWIELFGLEEEEPIFQKRVLSIVSGAILPIVALGFIKSLVDYIRPEQPEDPNPRYSPQPIVPQQPSPTQPLYEEDDQRMNIVGQNGNDGIHYDKVETPVAGSAEPITEEIIPDASEEDPEEDLYSRDAKKATIPAEIGEVVIAPETVKTDNADVNQPEKPVSDEHINSPTEEPTVQETKKSRNIDNRQFIRVGVEPKP
jgi:hypothetical protein